MKRWLTFGFLSVSIVFALSSSAGGCSSSGSQPSGSGANGAGGNDTGSMTTASSMSTPSSASGLGGNFATVGSGSSNGGAGGIDACAGTATKAELIPLDIYFMLDTSGSMADKTGANMNGPTKWDAVSTALTTFFQDPASAGLGAGLNFFPLANPGVPAMCTKNADCGNFGPCLLKACTNEASVIPCQVNNDCPNAGDQCVDLGMCGNFYCLPTGSICLNNFMLCVPLASSTCAQPDSCVSGDYATPAVEIDILNGAEPALTAAIMAKAPAGATPTAPALQGAVDHAKAWATAHPTHTVVAVLATDGLPTECMPQDIPSISNIASAAAAGNPAIKTFVIGVFAAADVMSKMNLDAIANAGGTNTAFIVDPAQNVEMQFEAALAAIRGSKLDCEFQVPVPDGGMLDYGQVNVTYTAPGMMKPQTILYVGSMANCDPMTGGWYYDVDPAMGGTPTKIIMCPATCTGFNGMGEVDIELGCKTMMGPPQ